mmetsp:Transcript_1629/g.3541  ORF Transcript_1629/g.3541 Transcript_1629/m.3541 type:complete len:443 (+) Transcript_1629:211-1539(+)
MSDPISERGTNDRRRNHQPPDEAIAEEDEEEAGRFAQVVTDYDDRILTPDDRLVAKLQQHSNVSDASHGNRNSAGENGDARVTSATVECVGGEDRIPEHSIPGGVHAREEEEEVRKERPIAAAYVDIEEGGGKRSGTVDRNEVKKDLGLQESRELKGKREEGDYEVIQRDGKTNSGDHWIDDDAVPTDVRTTSSPRASASSGASPGAVAVPGPGAGEYGTTQLSQYVSTTNRGAAVHSGGNDEDPNAIAFTANAYTFNENEDPIDAEVTPVKQPTDNERICGIKRSRFGWMLAALLAVTAAVIVGVVAGTGTGAFSTNSSANDDGGDEWPAATPTASSAPPMYAKCTKRSSDSWEEYSGCACRKEGTESGERGVDFVKTTGEEVDFDWCKDKCASDLDCRGFEYYRKDDGGRCEIYLYAYMNVEEKTDPYHFCFWKKPSRFV